VVFNLYLVEIKKPIAASLNTLWQIRNLTVTRADRARTLSQRLLRAQRLADTLRSESNDIYSKTMLQREVNPFDELILSSVALVIHSFTGSFV